MTSLEIALSDADALRALVEHQLSKGVAFLPNAGGVEPLTPCLLVVSFGGRSATLRAEIVYVRDDGPGRGVGLQLAPLGEEMLAALHALAEPAPLPLPVPTFEEPSPAPTAGEPTAGESSGEDDAKPDSVRAEPLVEGDGADSDDDDEGDDDAGSRAPGMHERLRSLSNAEQQRIALTGSAQERTLLERLYGPNVWESLLTGGRLTPPEVARIARKGTVPRPLLEIIGANGAWLSSPLVQRALLSNPRCPPTIIQRVLQSLPRRELALVSQQTAYPMAVRQAAKAMTKG